MQRFADAVSGADPLSGIDEALYVQRIMSGCSTLDQESHNEPRMKPIPFIDLAASNTAFVMCRQPDQDRA